jgi:Spy/CpxP family protein refolding chaperone
MKTKLLKPAMIAIAISSILMTIGLNTYAQRGQGRPEQRRLNQDERPLIGHFIPNLSPEQQTQIQELRTKHLKEVTPLRNELNEKRARLQTLQSAEKPDMNAINKTIDEMAQIKANIMKKGSAHRTEISTILTEDQRVVFNANRAGRSKKMGHRGTHMQGRMGICPYMQ